MLNQLLDDRTSLLSGDLQKENMVLQDEIRQLTQIYDVEFRSWCSEI